MCLSGFQAITGCMDAIVADRGRGLRLAVGVESLSDLPIPYSKAARKFMLKLMTSKSTAARLNMIKNFSAKAWVPQTPVLVDPLTKTPVSEHVEIFADELSISRQQQDSYAAESYRKAIVASERES